MPVDSALNAITEAAKENSKSVGPFLLSVMLFLVITAGGAGVAYGAYRNASPYGWILSFAAALGFVGICSTLLMNFHYGKAYIRLREGVWTAINQRDNAIKERNAKEEFLRTFRVPDSLVFGKLWGVARQVEYAHKTKVDFYCTGRTVVAQTTGDPEEDLRGMQCAFREMEELLEKEVKKALLEFRAIRDLAKSEGYLVQSSWKEYLDDEQGCEGRNEPPGQ